MPTIQQLPPALIVDSADEVPLSQAGATHAVSVGSLLAGMQPAILAPTGSLLGRLSIGPGGPEPVAVGTGLAVAGGNLVATGADHAAFPVEANPSAADQIVVTSSGAPKLLPLPALQSWLGAIGAPGTINFGSLPAAAPMASSDLIAISQNGTEAAVTYSNLIDGQTVDQASPALPASDTDTFWVAQGSSTMLRQTFSAIWNWAASKLASYKLPVVELSTNTTLDGTVHNGRILVCSQPVTLSPAFVNMGSGFSCEVLNLSPGNVTFAAGIATSTGAAILPPAQMALLRGVTYSGGDTILAAVVSGSGAVAQPTSPPGQVTNLASASVTASSIALGWSAPSSGGTPSSYAIQYRPSATTTWIAAPPTGSTSTTVGSLSPGTSYDFTVTAINAAGSGPVSAIVTTSTAAALTVPGQAQNLSATAATTSGITLVWSPPTSGGAPASYAVQYAVAGTSTWSTFATGVTGTTVTVTGLASGATYTFEVTATNAAGPGSPSAALTASTASAGSSVTSVTWNLAPASSYSVGSGAIAVNVHVNPSTASVQFGLSTATSTAPTTWVAGGYVNSDLWGAYIGTPVVSGTYYVWCEGTDGSARTVYPTSFTVS